MISSAAAVNIHCIFFTLIVITSFIRAASDCFDLIIKVWKWNSSAAQVLIQ